MSRESTDRFCPLCRASEGRPFYQDSREYFRCPICTLVFVLPYQFLSPKEEKSVYDGNLRPLLRAGYQAASTTVRLHCCSRSGRAFALSTTGIGQALVLSETGWFAGHHDQTRDRPGSFFTLALQTGSNACLFLFDRYFSMAGGPLAFKIDNSP